MALTLRHYPLASGVFNLTHLNENLSDIQDKFNGGIDNSDISTLAAIAPTKLSASNQEWTAQLKYHFGNQGAWPAVGATTPLDVVPVPGQSGDTSWIATDVTWVCNDVGDGAGSFDVRYGSFNGAGVWVNAGSIAAGTTIASVAANAGNEGRSARLAVSIPNGADVTSIALMSGAAGVGVVTAAGSFLCVSVRLRRVLQSI